MKTVLITGVAGFLGSHLSDFYVSNNYNVIGIDNLITGDLNNISGLKKKSNFKFYNIDITSSFKIDEKIDYILHFASPASPIEYLKIPIETLRVGSLGTDNILKIALKNKAPVLIASTSEIYGDPQEHPQKEVYFGNVNTIGPRGVYDEAKRYQEALTMAYHTFYGLDIRIARIFNTYGPRMKFNDGRALPTFIWQALNNEPVTIFGDGTQTRSFCYVDDLIIGINSLLMSDYIKPVNLGNPEEVTILEVANEIINLVESKSKIIFKALPKNDPLKRKPDITLAKKILKWSPSISRFEGINKTVKYFKDLKAIVC